MGKLLLADLENSYDTEKISELEIVGAAHRREFEMNSNIGLGKQVNTCLALSMKRIPRYVAKMFHNTALYCFLADRFAIIGAESRCSLDDVVYHGETADECMKYAIDNEKKVHLAGGLVLGSCGRKIYCEYIASLFYHKIERLQSRRQSMPSPHRLTRFLFEKMKKFYIDRPDMEIASLVGGYHEGALHVYVLRRMDDDTDVIMEEVTERITMLGSGKQHTEDYFNTIGRGSDIIDAYAASHQLYEAAHYASKQTKSCGGPVRNYIITETGVECLKYVHHSEADKKLLDGVRFK